MSSKSIVFKKKSLSRLVAIQVFYQYEFFNKEQEFSKIINNTIENYALNFDEPISSYKKNINQELLDNLIEGLRINIENIDKEISEFVKSPWTLDKLEEIIVQIIRFGCFELKYMKNNPAKSIINEYVDICASFFDEKQTTFVNAILDNLARKFRKNEFEEIKNE